MIPDRYGMAVVQVARNSGICTCCGSCGAPENSGATAIYSPGLGIPTTGANYILVGAGERATKNFPGFDTIVLKDKAGLPVTLFYVDEDTKTRYFTPEKLAEEKARQEAAKRKHEEQIARWRAEEERARREQRERVEALQNALLERLERQRQQAEQARLEREKLRVQRVTRRDQPYYRQYARDEFGRFTKA